MAKHQVNQKLVDEILDLYGKAVAPVDIKKIIQKRTGWKKTKSNEVFQQIINGEVVAEDFGEKDWKTNIQTLDKPYFNKETNQYITFIKAIGRNIVVSKEQHESILKMYSGWDGEQRTLTELCRNVQWPKPVLTEYLRKFGITHQSLPVTDEELADKSDEELLTSLTELRKFSLHQKLEKSSWDQIRIEAAKWRAFEHKHYSPFLQFLERFEPAPVKPIKSTYKNEDGTHTFLVSLSDVHFGTHIHPRYIYNSTASESGWSLEHTVQAIDGYATKIADEVNSRKYKFDKAVLCSLGDIIHGIDGKTEKGTILEAFPLGEEQFDTAFNVLITFISRIIEIFNKVEVHSVAGNHSLIDTILFKALKAYFRTDDRISFRVYDTRYAMFKVQNTLFVMEHGASAYYKSKLPSHGSARKAYIQDLFLTHPEQLVGVNQKCYISGDQHHFEANELGDVDQYMFSTPIGADKYADHNNWKNKPRQNCLVVDKSGVKEILNFYI